MITLTRLGIIGLTAVLLASSANAVVIYDTATRNTSAPTGALANSGWQYEGQWLGPTGGIGYLGTPIAPNYFITAHHVGGSVGDTFIYNSVTYTTTQRFDDPANDLTIWQVSGTFPTYAPLYSGSDELGKPLVVIGRGRQRGSDVVISGNTYGWNWGTWDGVQSWGQNSVNYTDSTYIGYSFNPITGQNEAAISQGDSGGGVFIQEGGVWKLAGINFGVDGPFKFAPTDASAFNATMFDMHGLYIYDANTNTSSGPYSGPVSSYATRISSSLPWIQGVVPEPGAIGMIVIAGLLTVRMRRRLD